MSKDTVPVEVHVLDKTYKVACPEDERDDLLESASYLDERMREVRTAGRVVGSERIATPRIHAGGLSALSASSSFAITMAQAPSEDGQDSR